jgi:hypothetical protein
MLIYLILGQVSWAFCAAASNHESAALGSHVVIGAVIQGQNI